jgi:hypothetical protein
MKKRDPRARFRLLLFAQSSSDAVRTLGDIAVVLG